MFFVGLWFGEVGFGYKMFSVAFLLGAGLTSPTIWSFLSGVGGIFGLASLFCMAVLIEIPLLIGYLVGRHKLREQ